MTEIQNPIGKAVQIHIADAGSIITATEVEGALQENRTAINLNTAHVGASGASHTYIDQDVSTSGTPSFSTVNALTLTAAATGFTIAGGTTSKTLTVDDNFVVSTQLTAIGANTTHAGDSTQAHSDYLLNNASDATSGTLTVTGGLISGANIISDTADTDDLGSSAVPWLNTYTGMLHLPATTATTGIIYSGANTLLHTYGATSNVFLGIGAGNLTLTGSGNIGIGTTVLDSLTSGVRNIGIGENTLTANTSGHRNIGFGYRAILSNQTGSDNVGIGIDALLSSTGSRNIAIGNYAGMLISSSTKNIAIGYRALDANQTGNNNIAIGDNALSACTAGDNVAVGTDTAAVLTAGTGNFAMGSDALRYNTTGNYNVAIGAGAGKGVSGQSVHSYDTFIGRQAGYGVTTGDKNVVVGYSAGLALTAGDSNILIGYQAGDTLTTGGTNIIIGYDIDATAVDVDSELNIGDLVYGDLTSGTGKIEIFDKGDLGSESLNEGAFGTHAKWDVTNDITDDVGNVAEYTWSANQTSTLTQTAANLAVAGVGNKWYKFVYTVAVTTAPDGDCTATITTGFAASAQTLIITAGTHTLYFKSKAAPTDFVISIVSGDDSEGQFSFDDLTLEEIIGGDLTVHGDLTAKSGITSGGNILSDTDSTDDLGSSSKYWANAYIDKIYISNTYSQTDISIYGYTSGAARNQGIYLENADGYAYLILKGDGNDAGRINFASTNYPSAGYIRVYLDDMTIDAEDDVTINAAAGIWKFVGGTFYPNLDSSYTLGLTTKYFDKVFTDELLLTNVGASAAAADKLVLSAVDLSAGNTILDINTEGTDVVGTGTPAADRTVAVRVNGAVIYLIGSTAAS